MDKQFLLEKYIKVAVRKALKEQEEQQKRAEKSLYTIYRFPGLKKLMEDLMSPAFGRYLKHVDIVAPKPTTFDVKLINGQEFNIIYVGKGNFIVKIAGKKYNPLNLGELERASQSIATLLQLNYAPEEGKEQPTSGGNEEMGKELAAAEKAPEEKPAEEEKPEPVAEGLKKKIKTLNEMNISVLNEDQDDRLSNIFSYIGDENQLSKIEIFDKLAAYTLQYYSSEMGDLKIVFPEIVNTITDWRREELVPERESNVGKEVETCIINYSNKVKNIEANDVANRGRGQDAIIGGKTVEIKSSKDNKINTQLQTTYYSSDKFYVFVSNTSSKDIQVRVVYGELLRNLSFGQEISKSTNIEEIGNKLEDQVKKGLEKLDFASMIKTSLVQGPTDRETSFKIGNKLKVRFVIYFEPTYGRGKKNSAEE